MDRFFVIVTTNKYPEGDAGAVRQHTFACLLRDMGYTPVVVGLGATTDFTMKEYDGIKYYSFRYPKDDTISKAKSHLLFKYNLNKILKKYDSSFIKGILFVNGRESTIDFLKAYSRKNNVQLYHDSVEWYSPSEFQKGEKAKGYIANNKLNTELIDTNFKVFAISSFLEKHFKSLNIDALRVPVIMDTSKINSIKNTNPNYIKIVYAGQMGPKDRIVNFIRALELLNDDELKRIKIVLIGITKDAFEAFAGVLSQRICECIEFTGRIPREDVLKHLESADFTMLLRPENERYAKAGFPTKVVESLASATPVICNYTSDLKMYLNDGENSVIVKDTTIDNCVESLQRAVNLSLEERQEMQFNARKTAEKFFDYRKYEASIGSFIS